MKLLICPAMLVVTACAEAQDSCLLRAAQVLDACGKDIPAMKAPADETAKRLAAGGKLWVAGSRAMISELSGRAGGFMGIRPLKEDQIGASDVILNFPESDSDNSPKWTETGAFVVAFGTKPKGFNGVFFSDHAGVGKISPSLAVCIPAWLFTGEMISALTRIGKMPVVYESIGAYYGMPRIDKYKNGEIFFHEDMKVPPVEVGFIAHRYVEAVSAMLHRIEKEQRDNIDRAGGWCREAKTGGKRLYMYSMGHLFPDEIERTDIGKTFKSAVWNSGFRHPKPDDPYGDGDVAIHIGYQHPPNVLLGRARAKGTKVVYVSLRSERNFVADNGVVWIDPMWDWPDACVPIAGYDVPLLPASGVVNGAVAWEIYRLTCGK
ncbi:MAG TPA: hypothetical protein PL033_18975 [Candidatus Brocadiia bacterium]|nr:hypothetical protein [Candidatus Brocadiia bacterium]